VGWAKLRVLVWCLVKGIGGIKGLKGMQYGFTPFVKLFAGKAVTGFICIKVRNPPQYFSNRLDISG